MRAPLVGRAPLLQSPSSSTPSSILNLQAHVSLQIKEIVNNINWGIASKLGGVVLNLRSFYSKKLNVELICLVNQFTLGHYLCTAKFARSQLGNDSLPYRQ